jgi:hypothetical protein
MLDLKTPGDAEAILSEYIGLTSPTPEQTERARQALVRCSDLVHIVHQAATRPKCVIKRTWDFSDANFVPMIEPAQTRRAVRILTAESLLLAQTGKGVDAVHNQALGFAIARQIASDRFLDSYLVGQAVDAITLSGMQKILYASNGDAAVARAVQATIEQEWQSRSLVQVMKSQAAEQQSYVALIRRVGFFAGLSEASAAESGEPEPEAHKTIGALKAMAGKGDRAEVAASEKVLMDANAAYLLRQTRKAIEAVDLPYQQAMAAITPIESDIAQTTEPDQRTIRLLAVVVTPTWSAAIKKKDSAEAFAQAVRIGAAVLAYRATHNGSLPETLDGAISPVPTDPFDGKPLRYRQEVGLGFVVYSVGPEGTFDGGKPGVKVTGNDSVLLFRFPAAR